MQVVLREDIQGVGRRGDIVDVAGGFARNYLLPTGKAIASTDGIASQALAMRRNRDLKDSHDREAAVSQAEALRDATIVISARASGEGRLFGSVSTSDIAEAIEKQKGVAVDRKHVVLDEPLKHTGNHQVSISLYEDVDVTVAVEVEAAS